MLTALRPARARRTGRWSPAMRTRRAVTRRTVRHPVGGPPPGDAAVFVVSGGDMVAVFDNDDAASIQYHVMVGAGLDVTVRRLTATRWERVRADLATRLDIKILDVRTGSPEVAS